MFFSQQRLAKVVLTFFVYSILFPATSYQLRAQDEDSNGEISSLISNAIQVSNVSELVPYFRSGDITSELDENGASNNAIFLREVLFLDDSGLEATFQANTEITTKDGDPFDLMALGLNDTSDSNIDLESYKDLAWSTKFGIDGQDLIFSKPVKLKIPVSGVEDGETISVEVQHASDTQYGDFGLTNSPDATCFPDGSVSDPYAKTQVQDGYVVIYTCWASNFNAVYVWGKNDTNFFDNNDPAGTNFTTTVSPWDLPAWVTITDVNILLDFHSVDTDNAAWTPSNTQNAYSAELSFTVTSPVWTTVNLINTNGLSNGAGTERVTFTFDDSGAANASWVPSTSWTFTPVWSLATLNGQNPFGNWVLNAQDTTGQDGAIIYGFTVEINATDPNNVPADISLSSENIDENLTSGTTVWTLSTTDADVWDTHTYSLACAVSWVDDSSFAISGSNLNSAASFDFETKSTYSICIRTNDGEDTFDKNFTISVNDLDEVNPVITLIGSWTVELFLNDSYTDASATASDDVDGDITGDIVVVNPVDTSIAGSYTVTYNVSDAAGNSATQITRTVNVTAPSPGGSWGDLLLWLKADEWIPAGATVTSWADSSWNGYDFSDVGSNPYNFISNGLNFNPTIDNPDWANRRLERNQSITPQTVVLVTIPNNPGWCDGPFGERASDDANIRVCEAGGTRWRLASGNTADFSANWWFGWAWFNWENIATDPAHNNQAHILTVQSGSPEIIWNGLELWDTLSNRFWHWDIAEVIAYGDTLTWLERPQIESYLALKYGITLDSSIVDYRDSQWWSVFNYDGTYNSHIVGIAKDQTSSLDQQISKSIDSGSILTISTDSDFTSVNGGHDDTLSFGQYLVIWSNSGATTIQTSELDTWLYVNRTTREWRVENTNSTGTGYLKFDGFDDTYVLLTDSDGDFSSWAVNAGALNASGVIDIVLWDNSYFTLATPITNTAPTDIALSGTWVDENVVWDSDNGSFTISGSTLSINDSPDFEIKDTYTVRIQTDDGNGGTYSEAFSISINDLDEINPIITITAPTKLSNTGITDTTIVVTDNLWVNAADISVWSGTATTSSLSCSQSWATTVNCTISIDTSWTLIINADDTSGNTWSDTESWYVVDTIAPNVPNVSVDTNGPFSVDNPQITFSALDNVAVDRFTITYNTDNGVAWIGASTTDDPVTSQVVLTLDPDELVHSVTVTVYDSAGNSSSNTVSFPPNITFFAPTTLSGTTITDSTVTISAPSGQPISNIILTPGSTNATLWTCTGSWTDLISPYNSPVTCLINNITASGTVTISWDDASIWATGMNSQSYIIDTVLPVVTITAPTKLDNTSITDTTIQITDNIWIYASWVIIWSGSATNSSFSCAQTSMTQVDCTVSIDDSGDLNISALDMAGNIATESENLYVIDVIAPIISLVWSGTVTISQWDVYTDAWALCSDNIDDSCSTNSSWSVDSSTPWVYTIDYSASDIAGNNATIVTRTITVTAAPILINEIEYDPTGSESEWEWIELYNPIGNVVSLSGWTLTEWGGSNYTFTWWVTISALWYLLVWNDAAEFALVYSGSLDIDMQDSDSPGCFNDTDCLRLNNGWDSLTLTDNTAATVDTVEWEQWIWSSVVWDEGKSICRTSVTDNDLPSDWTSNCIPTPWGLNITDTTPPIITLNGSWTINLEIGDSYSDAGATYTDDVDGTGSIVAVGWPVTTSATWSFTLTYDYTDTAGNIGTWVTRTVNVLDTTAPVISLNGAGTITLEIGDSYTDSGATYTDNLDGTGSIVAAGWPVTTSSTGSFTLTYDITDVSGNTATGVTRTVNVLDTTPPVITLIGTWVTVVRNASYTDSWATANDNLDGDISLDIVTNNTVDTSGLGAYSVTYNITDASGNAATQIVRTVTIIEWDTPVISLIGSWTVSIEKGSSYTDLWATYSDSEDGTGSVVWTGIVDISTVWTYTYSFDFTDSSDNAATQVTRTINVVDTTPPDAPTISSPTTAERLTDNTPTLTGTGEAGTIFEVRDAGGTLLGTGTVDGTGNYSFTPSTALPDGITTFEVTLVDESWNFSPTESVTFSIDTTLPLVTISAPTKLNNSAITDTTIVITDNLWINAADVTVWSGSTATTSSLSCTQSWVTTVNCTISVDTSGILIISADDTSGNTGTDTESWYVVDTVAPNVPTYNTNDGVATTVGWSTTDDPVTSPVVLNLDPDETLHTVTVTVYDAAWNSSSNTISFPPSVTFNAPTTLSGTTIIDSTVTISNPSGNDISNITLIPGTTNATLWVCTGSWSDTIAPYVNPVICNINNITASWTITVSWDDASIGATGLNSQSYIIDIVVPSISILAPTKLDNVSITDTTIQVTDNIWILAANVVLSWSTATTSSYSCTQTNANTVDCSISIDDSWDLQILATDNAGNTLTGLEIGYVIDTTPPVISLLGSWTITLEIGDSYSDFGAEYSDNIDGTGSIVATGWPVSTSATGSFVLSYDITDAAWNIATTVTRTVNVVDTTPPVITITGSWIVTVILNASYSDAGATCSDNLDTTCTVTSSGTVDTTTIGWYTIDYDVTDASGNAASTVTRIINVISGNPPFIILNGSGSIDIEVGSIYTDLWAVAKDDEDGTITPSMVTVNPVDSNVVWSYNVTYNVIDSSWNPATQITRIVNVLDTTPPVISLLGSTVVTLEIWDSYSDAGAEYSDNYDGTWSLVASWWPVTTSATGSFTLTYDHTDVSGNSAFQITRTVNVVDTTPPVITITGSGTVNILRNTIYIDDGATCNDNLDSLCTVTASGTVDGSTLGTYFIDYNTIDASWNVAITQTRTVSVIAWNTPVISLQGTTPLFVELGTTYTDSWATALDSEDGDISPSIVVVNPINTSVTGSYTVTYNVIDSSLNPASQVVRLVNVVDSLSDGDGDGVPDIVEVQQWTDPTNSWSYLDTDGDLIPNYTDGDDDGDGSIDSVEQAAPNAWDYNNDGLDDVLQNSVATTVNSVIWSYHALDTTDGWVWVCWSTNFSMVPESTFTTQDTVNYPIWLADFELACTSTGATANIKLYLDQDYDTSIWVYKKYNTLSEIYTDISSIVTYTRENIGGTNVTVVNYSITDGGVYDEDGIANRIIIDPSGPSFRAASSWWSGPSYDKCDGDDTSWSIYDGLCGPSEVVAVNPETDDTQEVNPDQDDQTPENEQEESTEWEIDAPVKWEDYLVENDFDSCPIIKDIQNPNYSYSGERYSDTALSRYESEIDKFSHIGVVNGYRDGSFGPRNEMTRAEFLKVALISHCYEYQNEDTSDLAYRDVDLNSWQARVISKAQALGMINGDINEAGENVFRPDDIISKAEAVKILMKLSLIAAHNPVNLWYEDITTSWHEKYVIAWETLWLFDSDADKNKFYPDSWVRREEMIDLVNRLVQLYK